VSQYDEYFQRVYSDLPSHTMIRYTITIWAIGVWRISGTNDYFRLSFDSQIVDNLSADYATFPPEDICGGGNLKDLKDFRVFGIINHSSSSLDFRVISRLTHATDRLIGFRNVNFLFGNGPVQNNLYCAKAPGPVLNNECTCIEGEFYNGTSCETCHSNCLSCYGPSSQECFQCKYAGTYEGMNCHVECNSLKIEYLSATKTGHRFQVSTLPNICYTDVNLLTLNLTPITQNITFNFTVFQINKNEYIIDLVLYDSILQDVEVNITISPISSKLTIPRTFIPSEAVLKAQESVSAIQNVMIGLFATSVVGTLALGSTAALWSIISLQQFIGYFLYLNVQYPSHVELMLSMLDFSIWSIFPNPLDSFTSSISENFISQKGKLRTDFQPPPKFRKYGITIFFIDNGGAIITINLMLLLSLLVVLSLKRISSLSTNSVLKYLKVRLRWNLIARSFLENTITLSLATFLQLRTLSFNGAYLAVCGIFTIFSMIYLSGMCFFLFRILRSRPIEHLKLPLIKRIYGTLYEGINLKTASAKYYYLIVLFRGALLTLVIALWDSFPLLQISPLIFFNAWFVYYIFKNISFEAKAQNIIVRIKEILILIGEILIWFLMIKTENINYYEVFGWLVIIVLGSAVGIETCYLFYLQIVGIKHIYTKILNLLKSFYSFLSKLCQEEKSSKKVVPAKLNETELNSFNTNS